MKFKAGDIIANEYDNYEITYVVKDAQETMIFADPKPDKNGGIVVGGINSFKYWRRVVRVTRLERIVYGIEE